MRIAVIINMIAPYTTPVFERLAQREDCDLLVAYETRMEPDRLWQAEADLPYEHVVLDSWTFDLSRLAIGSGFKTRFDTYLYVPKRPLASLRDFSPDVVIGAGSGIWSSPANIITMLVRRRAGWAFVPWWGSFSRKRPTWPRRLAAPWVRMFVRSADACMAYGTRAARDLAELGVDPVRTVIAPIVAQPPNGNASRDKRARHAVDARYLFVGRLIERKGIDVLLNAFRSVDSGELWIVGDGPLRPVVEAAAADRRIRLFGHLEGEQLAAVYQQATALVLASHYEVWGLVVNEALAYELPVIATDQVGAGDDLIDAGINGLIVPAGSSKALAGAMGEVAAWTPEQRERSAKRSREKLKAWSLDRAVGAFVHACSLALEHRRSGAT
jgi:glycosyltransferase involved in cell wall biosynthesis